MGLGGRPGLVASTPSCSRALYVIVCSAVLSQHTSKHHAPFARADPYERHLSPARSIATLLPNVYSLGAFAFYLGEALDRERRHLHIEIIWMHLPCVLFLSVLFHLAAVCRSNINSVHAAFVLASLTVAAKLLCTALRCFLLLRLDYDEKVHGVERSC